VASNGLPRKVGLTAFDLGPHVNNFEDGVFSREQLSGDEVLCRYLGVNKRNGRTHNYVTDKRHTSEVSLRDDLTILYEWASPSTESLQSNRPTELRLVKVLLLRKRESSRVNFVPVEAIKG
jgi:hypothetical protein